VKAKSQKPQTNVRTIREFSAGGVIWRRGSQGGIEVVLVSPAGKESLTLPKGQVERGESLDQTAIRECREETGLTVKPGPKLGEISYIYSRRETEGSLLRIIKKVYFFLMEYESGHEAPQKGEIDEVIWMPIEQARERCSYENERALIEKSRQLLD
jgi:8-oxo-dGTP pyrophosphatase MutT (NUDIX family)